MIDAEEVLVIYNQDHPEKPAQRITAKVKDHMDHRSQQAGWAGTAHVKNAKTGHGAGLLLLAPQQSVNVNVLVLPEVQEKPKAKRRAAEDVTDV
ncbi:hypothetical protein [Stenotrophomonas maltophilia]|uniref:hypothetical protein n=1 Tax=Stenotrophomonas maltophilia TaxID=40324 RepID=UPI0025E90477|nr:hypothetical protein [uncultured Stenotrophomonas sp.]